MPEPAPAAIPEPTPDNLWQFEAQTRAGLLSNLAYHISLELGEDPALDTFASRTEITFDALPGASTFIELEAASISRIILNQEVLDPQACSAGRISLPNLRAQNHLLIEARCRYSHIGMGLHRAQDPSDGQTYVYTQFEPYEAHRVFACFDQMDLKARFSLVVTAPAAWEVISNAPVENQRAVSSNSTTTQFAPSVLMSPYLVAVIAGPYSRVTDYHHGIELNLYCRNSLRPFLEAEEIFTITKQGLDYFPRRFGLPYPFGTLYNQLFVPEFNAGAMENLACVTFFEDYTIFRGPVTAQTRAWRARTILHEMAHTWFGNLVSMVWHSDLWLKESFATYMEIDAASAVTSYQTGWLDFANADKSFAARQDQLPTTHPIVAAIPDVNSARLNYDGITYNKGAAVFRQLVAWVGEANFFQGLQAYFLAHQWSNASLQDLLAPLEAASGRDLASWSKAWLETAGMNSLQLQVEEQAGLITTCALNQSAALADFPTLRPHRLNLGFYDFDASGRLLRTTELPLDAQGPRTPVPAALGLPRPALIIPNDGDLTFAKIRLDPHSWQTIQSHLSSLADPLARQLLWAAAWDMTRDAELSVTDYINLVCRHLPLETEPTMVDGILKQALDASTFYVHPDHQKALRKKLRQTLWTLYRSAPAGSALQLTALRNVLACSDKPSDLTFAANLLQGLGVPPDLEIDQDLRWFIICRLAARNLYSSTAIQAEALRDPGDRGVRQTAAALAARPLASAKRAAWNHLNQPDTPFALQDALIGFPPQIGGLQQPGQQALLAPYFPLWLEQLPFYWSHLSPDEAEQFTSGLFPRQPTPAQLLQLDEYLATTQLPLPARRVLLEKLDDARRQHRAQAKDQNLGG